MVVGSVIEFKDKSSNPRNGLSHENKYMYLADPELVYVREWEEFIDKFQCCNLDLLN